MNKNMILSMLLIIVLLYFPAMIMVSDPITLNDMKIQYTYFNSKGEVEFGEIKNGQELAIFMRYGDQFLVKIWNYTDEDFYLDKDQPFNIIEGQDFIYIESDTDTRIPAGMCVSFWIFMDIFSNERKRGVIEIRSENSEDKDFVFGLWKDMSC